MIRSIYFLFFCCVWKEALRWGPQPASNSNWDWLCSEDDPLASASHVVQFWGGKGGRGEVDVKSLASSWGLGEQVLKQGWLSTFMQVSRFTRNGIGPHKVNARRRRLRPSYEARLQKAPSREQASLGQSTVNLHEAPLSQSSCVLQKTPPLGFPDATFQPCLVLCFWPRQAASRHTRYPTEHLSLVLVVWVIESSMPGLNGFQPLGGARQAI